MQKAHHDCSDGGGSAFEAAEEDGGCDDGGTSKEDVISWGDECGVEDVEGFLIGLLESALVWMRISTHVEIDDFRNKCSNDKDKQNI